MFIIRTLAGRIVLGALALFLVAGAGWYFLIREDNQLQKEAATVTNAVRHAAAAQSSAASTQSAGAGNASASTSDSGMAAASDGASSSVGANSYRIVEGQSSAWYLAPEKLASLPTSSVARGTTNGVSGEFHFTATGLDPAAVTSFTVDLTALSSDQSMPDRRVQSALDTGTYPTATFTATSLTGLPGQFSATDTVMQLTGILEIHGVKQTVTWELKVKDDGGILSGLATLKLKYTDFGITKPEVANFVSVEDELTIQVQLFAAPV